MEPANELLCLQLPAFLFERPNQSQHCIPFMKNCRAKLSRLAFSGKINDLQRVVAGLPTTGHQPRADRDSGSALRCGNMLPAEVGTVGTECSKRAENENASTAAMSPISGITGSRELLARTGATGLGGPMVAAKNTTVLYQEAVRLQGLGRDRAKSGGFEDGGSAARRLDLGGRGSAAGGSISGMGISGGRVS
jgi:hypothetical protein